MAALISVVQNSGASYASYAQEVAKNISYFVTVDNGLASKTAYPLSIPPSGKNYSYEVWIRLRCDLAPNDRCENFKAWYVSGLPANGYNITVNSDVVNTYSQPVDTPSDTGTRVDFTTKNSEVNSIALDGTLENIGDYTSWLCFQLEVESDADTGLFEISYLIEFDEF